MGHVHRKRREVRIPGAVKLPCRCWAHQVPIWTPAGPQLLLLTSAELGGPCFADPTQGATSGAKPLLPGVSILLEEAREGNGAPLVASE